MPVKTVKRVWIADTKCTA